MKSYVNDYQVDFSYSWCVSVGIAPRSFSLGLTGAKSTLIQIIVWGRQALPLSHYLSQFWTQSKLPYGVIRSQRVLYRSCITFIIYCALYQTHILRLIKDIDWFSITFCYLKYFLWITISFFVDFTKSQLNWCNGRPYHFVIFPESVMEKALALNCILYAHFFVKVLASKYEIEKPVVIIYSSLSSSSSSHHYHHHHHHH